jgi:hypothetical protein
MDAIDSEGELLTRPLRFEGKYLFVNLDAPEGSLRVELQDRKGEAFEPFTSDHCSPLAVDSTIQMVDWEVGSDISPLAGQMVRFRFRLSNGRLYSFWVSPDITGASHGYIAAGGPGFTGPTDTVGRESYR